MNWSDVLHVARYALGAGLIGANVAVWYGVWLERESAPKDVQERGWRILVRALAAEAAIGLFLFAADTGIDVMQRTENAVTYERATNAEREAGRLGVKIGDLNNFVAREEGKISRQMDGFRRYAVDQKRRFDEITGSLAKSKSDLEKARTDALAASELTKRDLSQMQALLNQEAVLRQQMIAVLTPRHFSPEQQREMKGELANFAPMRVDILTFGDTREISDFGRNLADTLEAAGWKPKVWSVMSGSIYGVTGVPVYARKGDSKADSAASALVAAILGQRISAKQFEPFEGTAVAPFNVMGPPWDEKDSAPIRVWVGPK